MTNSIHKRILNVIDLDNYHLLSIDQKINFKHVCRVLVDGRSNHYYSILSGTSPLYFVKDTLKQKQDELWQKQIL